MEFVNLDGKLLEAKNPVIGLDNRSFRYGDCVFESLRGMHGKCCFAVDHYARLINGMKALKMAVPQSFTANFFEQSINQLLEHNGHKEGSRIRFSVFRNSEGYYRPHSNQVSYSVESVALPNNMYAMNEKGLRIDIFDEYKKPLNKFSSLKTANSLPFVLAGIYASERELDDCILLNEQGGIAEATSSNIFIIYNGVFYTPSVNQGCIEGIMRSKIIQFAQRKNIGIQECTLGPSALIRADEVFLTNSITGIRWVGSYRQKRYFKKISDIILEEINKDQNIFLLPHD